MSIIQQWFILSHHTVAIPPNPLTKKCIHQRGAWWHGGGAGLVARIPSPSPDCLYFNRGALWVQALSPPQSTAPGEAVPAPTPTEVSATTMCLDVSADLWGLRQFTPRMYNSWLEHSFIFTVASNFLSHFNWAQLCWVMLSCYFAGEQCSIGCCPPFMLQQRLHFMFWINKHSLLKIIFNHWFILLMPTFPFCFHHF